MLPLPVSPDAIPSYLVAAGGGEVDVNAGVAIRTDHVAASRVGGADDVERGPGQNNSRTGVPQPAGSGNSRADEISKDDIVAGGRGVKVEPVLAVAEITIRRTRCPRPGWKPTQLVSRPACYPPRGSRKIGTDKIALHRITGRAGRELNPVTQVTRNDVPAARRGSPDDIPGRRVAREIPL